MTNGVLAGYEVQSLKVTVLDGSYHPVDSDQLSFEMAGRLAFRHACPKAKPVLLEPIMSLEVVTPEDYMGDIVGDLNRRRGQIQAMDSTANGARDRKGLRSARRAVRLCDSSQNSLIRPRDQHDDFRPLR